MRMTVEFTSVYPDGEQVRTAVLDVENPGVTEDELYDWAGDNLQPHTGDGKHTSGHAGYFAEIRDCADRPDLVGREFSWGV